MLTAANDPDIGKIPARPERIGSLRPRRFRSDPFGHEDAVIPGLVPPPGFAETEPRIERDVLGHLFMRIEPQHGIAEPLRLALGENDQSGAGTTSMPLR